MVFSHIRDRSRHTIRLGNTVIRASEEAKFLGVTLSPRLNWLPHIRRLATKAMHSVGLIKLLSRQTWVTPQSLVHLIRALVRPRLVYGCECFFNAANDPWKRLERVELKALKTALGLPPCAINDLVYQEVGWLPLREQCRLNVASLEARASTVPNCVKEVLGTDFAQDPRRAKTAMLGRRALEEDGPIRPCLTCQGTNQHKVRTASANLHGWLYPGEW